MTRYDCVVRCPRCGQEEQLKDCCPAGVHMEKCWPCAEQDDYDAAERKRNA